MGHGLLSEAGERDWGFPVTNNTCFAVLEIQIKYGRDCERELGKTPLNIVSITVKGVIAGSTNQPRGVYM
jgi:hypothetical protein